VTNSVPGPPPDAAFLRYGTRFEQLKVDRGRHRAEFLKSPALIEAFITVYFVGLRSAAPYRS
jgi:hypothetical protein